ncbi:MAG: hypothetical protein WAW37_01435 [Syntrophobacteraceae bacterium]
MKRRSFAACALCAFLLLLPACARPPAPVERPAPVPFDTARLKQRSDFWRDCRAKFRLKVESKTAKFSARAVVLIKGAQFARFETFGPIGQTAALFVVNETGPALFIPSEKVIFTASRPETLIRYFLGVSLPFETFRHALAASVPQEQIEGLDTRMDGGVLHAVSKAGGRLFDWSFLPGGPDLKGVHVRDDQFDADIAYEPPVPLATEAVPKKIRLSASDWNMEVTVEAIEPARDFQPSVFYLPELPDMKKVDLDKIK